MPKVISYKELNALLREPLILESDIINLRFKYIGTEEHIELVLKTDEPLIKAYVEQVYVCHDCEKEWNEPGLLVKVSCRFCGSEDVEHLGLSK